MQIDDRREQARLNAENLAFIIDPDARDAYRIFREEGEAAGIEMSVLASSGTKPLRFYREIDGQRAYFFSCDRTASWLRCYVRGAALRAWPELRTLLLGNGRFEAEELNGEVRVIIRRPDEARALAGLLFNRGDDAAHEAGADRFTEELRLVADSADTARAFREWFDSLTGEARDQGGYFLLPAKGIGLRQLGSVADDEQRLEFWVGDSSSSAVQINQPNTPGSENPLGGLAVDADGGRYIVRQGVLHPNHTSDRINAEEFAARTGLRAVKMRDGQGRIAKRQWHIVTPLDDIPDTAIVRNTADFVERCWLARTWDSEADADQDRLAELFGNTERGGYFDYTPDPTPRRVLRIQGEVWQALSTQLAVGDIRLEKPRHARGYEVDAEIRVAGRSLLIEIKTGFAAADYYCGVGQLMLYPALLPRLKGHTKILLLPEKSASSALEKALRPLNIAVHRYRVSRGNKIDVRFSSAFLQLCGLSDEQAAEAQAF